jgi:hypothetical protein
MELSLSRPFRPCARIPPSAQRKAGRCPRILRLLPPDKDTQMRRVGEIPRFNRGISLACPATSQDLPGSALPAGFHAVGRFKFPPLGHAAAAGKAGVFPACRRHFMTKSRPFPQPIPPAGGGGVSPGGEQRLRIPKQRTPGDVSRGPLYRGKIGGIFLSEEGAGIETGHEPAAVRKY